jgi:hypothetical protein|uniref:Uncharacterized protein n=1 Tax=Zea mays TaxID=4577 RepID=A0A804QB88_MAIZE
MERGIKGVKTAPLKSKETDAGLRYLGCSDAVMMLGRWQGVRQPVSGAGAARRGWLGAGARLAAGVRSVGPSAGEGERLQGRSVPGPGAGGTARCDARDAKSQPVTALLLYKPRRLLLFRGKAYLGEPVR